MHEPKPLSWPLFALYFQGTTFLCWVSELRVMIDKVDLDHSKQLQVEFEGPNRNAVLLNHLKNVWKQGLHIHLIKSQGVYRIPFRHRALKHLSEESLPCVMVKIHTLNKLKLLNYKLQLFWVNFWVVKPRGKFFTSIDILPWLTLFLLPFQWT